MAAKSPCPRAAPLGSGLFTAIIPSAPCYNYYIKLVVKDFKVLHFMNEVLENYTGQGFIQKIAYEGAITTLRGAAKN